MDADESATPPKRKRKPPTYEELIDRGLRQTLHGRKADARRSYLTAIEVDPNQTAAWFGLAHVTRDETERRATLRRVLEIDPENERAKEQIAQFEAHDRRMAELRAAQAQMLADFQARQKQYEHDRQARIATQAQRVQQQQQIRSIAPMLILGLFVVLALMMWSIGSGRPSPSTPTYYNASPSYATSPPVQYSVSPSYSSPSYSGGSTCADGTHSSSTGRGTCSHHGGIAR